MSKNKYEIDMCNGTIMDKLISFSVPLMLSGILQLMFNAVDIIVVGRFAGRPPPAAACFFFVLFFHFGVLRYVFLGPYFRFLSFWGIWLCSRWSVLSFCFFLPFSFVDFTISVFSPFVNTLF